MTPRRRLTLALIALPLVVAFLWLGVWQVHRRAWKLALIAQVDAKRAAAPVAAPGPGRQIAENDAYTRVAARGHYLPDRDTYVQAATELGGGYWVVTPFTTDRGFTILVNRGFVPPELRGRAAPSPATQVTGLLRLSEPNGGFLRNNVPADDRWYSRDVAAIAAKRALGPVIPYFVDADRTGDGWPRGGMTVVHFRNAHLSYALTWFALAAALAGAMGWMVTRREDGRG